MTAAAALALAATALTGPFTSVAAQPSPSLSFTPSAVNFSVSYGEPREFDVTLTNTGGSGTGPLAIEMEAADSLFTISGEACPKSLGARRSCTVTVRFAPTRPVLDAGATLTATSTKGASAALTLEGIGRDDTLPQANSCDPDADGVSEKCFYGTNGADMLDGNRFYDSYIWLYAGDDWAHGYYAKDTIYGGDGQDNIDGMENNDTLYGEEGADTIHGGNQSDYVHAGNGDDYVDGEAGEDRLYGGHNEDEIRGGIDADRMDGQDGNDLLEGGLGQDVIEGGPGNDVVKGNEYHDVLSGGPGTDEVYGGDADDTLNDTVGDGLADTLDGGGGQDTCYIYDVGLDTVHNCEIVINVN